MPQFFIIMCFEKNTLKNTHKTWACNRYTRPKYKTSFITLLFLIMGRPADLQITHWMGSSFSPGGRKILAKKGKCHQEGWFLFFFVVRGMCVSESWGTKKLVSALQKRSIATGKHLAVVCLLDFLKIHVHSLAVHVSPALNYECF